MGIIRRRLADRGRDFVLLKEMSPMKRRGKMLILAGVVAVVGTVALVWLLTDDPVTPAAFDRIEVGMTPAELRALLGPPTTDRDVVSQIGAPLAAAWNLETAVWFGRERTIIVGFHPPGPDGRVARKELWAKGLRDVPLEVRVLRSFGLDP